MKNDKFLGVLVLKKDKAFSENILDTHFSPLNRAKKNDITLPVRTPKKVMIKVSWEPNILETKGIAGAMVMGEKINDKTKAKK